MDLQYETVDKIKKNEHWYDTCDVAVAKEKRNDAPQIRRISLSWKYLIILFLVVLILSLCTSLAVSVLMNTPNDNLPLSKPKIATDAENTMRDCLAMKENDSLSSGVYSLVLNDTMLLDVYCDMTTHKGGWIVFQKRFNGKENFYRDWHAYENGFGDLNGEFWIGNKYLHILTQVPTELRIDVKAWDFQMRYAEYSTFVIGDAKSKYTLSIDGFHGDAGDGLEYHDGRQFSTYDQDNSHEVRHCAKRNRGAWWYGFCSHSSLNGVYLNGTNGTADKNVGVNWEKFKGDYYSLKSASMMLRRKIKE